MNKGLEILKQELFEKWIETFDEFDHFKNYEKEVVSVRYADDSYAYDIKDFNDGQIESAKTFYDQPQGDSYCEYGLNKNGQPVVSILYSRNIVFWIGFYKWAKDLIEFREFCYSNRVPSALHRLTLKNNKKVALQSLNLNGRGGFSIFSSMSKEEIIKHTFSNSYNLMLDIKQFNYANDKIISADGFASVPGIGEYTYEDVYSYDNSSSLNKIERFTEKWPPQLTYIRPSGRTIEKLVDDLSKLLSDEIINAFAKEKIEQQIFNIQLNYHAVDNYWPYITIIKDKEKEEAITNKTELLFIGGIPVANEILRDDASDEFDEMFTEFDQYVQVNEAWDIGSELLIKTSILLNENKLKGTVAVSDDFIVFATDWSMSYNIEEILLKCGASKKNVKRWKDLHWF